MEEKRGKVRISVIMGAYDCEDTLEEAVESILAQTRTDWELLIRDDGSTDGTWDKIKELAEKDPRIRPFRNKGNKGLSKTLNLCLLDAKGEYVARMDADDVCSPNRFELQATVLDSGKWDIVGSEMTLFDENGEWGTARCPEFPTKEDVVEGTAIFHATTMTRRERLIEVAGYSESKRKERVEDLDLWIRMYQRGCRCRNLQIPLYSMRDDRAAGNRRKYRYRINSTTTRLEGCERLGLGTKSKLKAFKPMIAGLLPKKVRRAIRERLSRTNDENAKGTKEEP